MISSCIAKADPGIQSHQGICFLLEAEESIIKFRKREMDLTRQKAVRNGCQNWGCCSREKQGMQQGMESFLTESFGD